MNGNSQSISMIKVDTSNPDRLTVSGRSLHAALEVKTAYKDWFPRMVEYGFTEGEDFCSFLSESTGGRPAMDHQLTIAMAKEVAMVQRTPKGKEIRQYFIYIEEKYKEEMQKPEIMIARGLLAAEKLLEEKNAIIEKMLPKVQFADAVSSSDTCILIGDLAKILHQNGIDIGQNRLFKWMRENNYLIKGGTSYNMPTQRAVDMGLFQIRESVRKNPVGDPTIYFTTMVTPKGQLHFVNRFLCAKKNLIQPAQK